MSDTWSFREFHDKSELFTALLAKMESDLLSDLRKQEVVSICLAGGRTPKELYRMFALRCRDKVQWKRVHFFFGDERCVSPGHPGSNFRMVKEALFDFLPLPGENIHPMVTGTEEGWKEMSENYEKLLREVFCDKEKTFDILMLGLGQDGHTASLFPGSAAVKERERWVVLTEAPRQFEVRERMTLTFPVLNLAKRTIFLATGKEKERLVRDLVAGKLVDVPAAGIKSAEVFYTVRD